jgi:hypothetical protein
LASTIRFVYIRGPDDWLIHGRFLSALCRHYRMAASSIGHTGQLARPPDRYTAPTTNALHDDAVLG